MSGTLHSAGYSEEPAAEKLGYKPGQRAAFIDLPDTLAALSRETPFATVLLAGGFGAHLPPGEFDLIHAFVLRQAEVDENLPELQEAIRPDGMIWVSWPKKSSGIPTDVSDNTIREAALKLDLVDVKVAAVDEIWSGLKLVIRKDRR